MSETVVPGQNKPARWMPTRGRAIRMALGYAVLGGLWISLSGWLLHRFVHDHALAALLEYGKGWFFVLVTALILWLGLDSLFRRIRHSALQLQYNESQLRLLSDNLPDTYVYQFVPESDGKPRFIYVSAGVERVHGVKPADVMREADCLRSLVVPESRPALAAAEAESAKMLKNFEMEVWIRNPDGRLRLMHLRAHPHRRENGLLVWDGIAADITERVKAEQKLEEEQAILRGILNATTESVWLFSRDGVVLTVNETVLRQYGKSLDEVAGHHFSELMAEAAPSRAAYFQKVLRSHQPVEFEDEWGGILTHHSLYPIADASGVVTSVVSYCRDITERRRAEEALRESENKYRNLFEGSRDAILTVDPATGRFTSGNPAALKMFGVNLEAEIISRSPADFSPERQPDGRLSREKSQEIDQIVLREGSLFFEWKLMRADGQEFFADVQLTRIERGGKPAIMATIRDVTERKQVEQERMRLATALEQAAESIVITDLAGIIVYVNPAFEQISGYSRAEAMGRRPSVLKSGTHDANFYKRLWDTIRRGEVWHGRFVNRRKGGQLYEEEATISPVRDASGKVVNYMAIKLDVTHEVELEIQFRQAQKMEAIGQLAGGVAHDFNNILAAIMMQAEVTATAEGVSAEVREGLGEIRACTERAANLTRQLLLFSRRQVMQPRNLDLNNVVTSIARMLQRIIGEDIRLQLNLDSTSLFARADAGMLDQVLMNLAVNARDAMPAGGRLVIETGAKTVDADLAQLHPEVSPGRYVWLSVKDTGEGIPPEIMPRIFEPFFTTKEQGKGTGLGLATVFGIVQQHGGWVDVQSEPGRGTRFCIFIPAAEGASEDVPAAVVRPQPRGGTETILLAEDDRAVRELTRATLERHGYRVVEAASGSEAAKLWPEFRSQVVLLLTDLVMPGGLNGQQLARRLQADNPRLKVVYTTGYSADIAGRELELRPGENFMQKPYSPGHLLETVRRCLDG